MAECDAILVKGHWPHKDIFKYMTRPFHFIGDETTHFPDTLGAEIDLDILSFSWQSLSGKLYTFSTYDKFLEKANENSL
jgi:hypothetical protein